jgi:hypothetical protein
VRLALSGYSRWEDLGVDATMRVRLAFMSVFQMQLTWDVTTHGAMSFGQCAAWGLLGTDVLGLKVLKKQDNKRLAQDVLERRMAIW